MSIKAVFFTGQTKITVNGLHQWDYGRTLEIRADDLPTVIEVHFACAGMTEAVVRTCTGTLGVYATTIPDRCLEQTSPIVAWIYRVDETQAATIKTIILPIIARTRPQSSPTVPEIITDKYTDLIAAINEQVETLKNGDVVVAEARYAQSAKTAETAKEADTVIRMEPVWDTIFDGDITLNSTRIPIGLEPGGTYLFSVWLGDLGYDHTFILSIYTESTAAHSSSSLYRTVSGNALAAGVLTLMYTPTAGLQVLATAFGEVNTPINTATTAKIDYCRIG